MLELLLVWVPAEPPTVIGTVAVAVAFPLVWLSACAVMVKAEDVTQLGPRLLLATETEPLLLTVTV